MSNDRNERRRLLGGVAGMGALMAVSPLARAQDRGMPSWLEKLFERLGIERPKLGVEPKDYTDDQYSVLVRQRIYLRHIDTFSRKEWPFPQMGSVQVRIEIDAKGRVAEVRTLDSTGYARLRDDAERIVRDSFPFPAPPAASLRRGRAVIVDTFVFDNDGAFALKSVAESKPKRDYGAAG